VFCKYLFDSTLWPFKTSKISQFWKGKLKALLGKIRSRQILICWQSFNHWHSVFNARDSLAAGSFAGSLSRQGAGSKGFTWIAGNHVEPAYLSSGQKILRLCFFHVALLAVT
jgi:hypothetical protein